MPLPDYGRDPRYIGDGVYAGHDGYQIWLRAERNGRLHEIALEPEVLRALVDYDTWLRGKFSQQERG